MVGDPFKKEMLLSM